MSKNRRRTALTFRLMLSKYNLRKSLSRVLCSYLTVVFAIIICIVPVFFTVRSNLLNTTIRDEKQKTGIALANLNDQINILNTTFQYTSNLKGFDRISLIRGVPSPRDYIAMNNARTSLSSVAGANSMIGDIVIFFRYNDIVVTSSCVFDSRKTFFSFYSIPSMETMLSLAESESGTGGSQYTRFFAETTLSTPMSAAEDMIPLAIPLRSNVNRTYSYGMVFVFLKKEAVKNTVVSTLIGDTGFYQLIASDGTLVCGYDGALFESEAFDMDRYVIRAIDGETYVALLTEGPTLSLITGIPYRTFTDRFVMILQVMKLYILIATVLGVACSALLSARSLKPVLAIAENLDTAGYKDARSIDTYEYIAQSIDDIIAKNTDINNLVNTFRQKQAGHRLDRLLTGYPDDDGGEGCPIPLPCALLYGSYTVRGGSGEKAGDPLLLVITGYLEEHLPEEWIFHGMSATSFVLIAPLHGDNAAEKTAAKARELFNAADHLFSVKISCAVSPRCDSPADAARLFEMTRSYYFKVCTSDAGGNASVYPLERSDEADGELSLRDITALYHHLLSGEAQKAREWITYSFRHVNAWRIDNEQLYYSVCMVLLMAGGNGRTDLAPVPKYRHSLPTEQNVAALIGYVDLLCDRLRGEKKSHNECLKRDILQYIEEHYTDNALYSPEIARKVGISEKYLCNFIREQTGRTISDLLLSRRLDRARELLVTSDKPINAIWIEAGFTSHNTFYKAVRRQFGLSPSDLRATFCKNKAIEI